MMKEKLNAYKNLLGVCLSFVLSYASFIGIITIQSSINASDGLGLASSAVIFAVKMVTVPLMPAVVQLLGSKLALCVGYCLLFLYAPVNYYPRWFTLIPGAVLAGLADGPVWVSLQVHTVQTARKYAGITKTNPDHIVAAFTSLLAVSIKTAQILGSILSSAVLFNYDSTNYNVSNYNATLNESSTTCDNVESRYIEEDILYYILITLYSVCILLGIAIAFLLTDRYPTNANFGSMSKLCWSYFLEPFKELLTVSINWKMLLLIPLMLTNGMAVTFMMGHYTSVSSHHHMALLLALSIKTLLLLFSLIPC